MSSEHRMYSDSFFACGRTEIGNLQVTCSNLAVRLSLESACQRVPLNPLTVKGTIHVVCSAVATKLLAI